MSDYEVGVPLCEPTTFRWSQRCCGDAVVVSLAGELDVASEELGPLLLRLVESGPAETIVLDLSELEFIDASAVGVIVGACKAAKARGRVVHLSGVHGLPARVFWLAGLESVLAPAGGSVEGNAGDR